VRLRLAFAADLIDRAGIGELHGRFARPAAASAHHRGPPTAKLDVCFTLDGDLCA